MILNSILGCIIGDAQRWSDVVDAIKRKNDSNIACDEEISWEDLPSELRQELAEEVAEVEVVSSNEISNIQSRENPKEDSDNCA